MYDEWTKASTPIYMKYFVFNLTNPHEVMEGATPNVTQIGPYSYRYEVNRGYYMATRRYEISLRVLKNISRVSAANE